jgi:hypothetical protein
MTRETQTEPSSRPVLESPGISQLIQDSEQWFLLTGVFPGPVKVFVSPVQSQDRPASIELEMDTSLLPSNLDVRIGREVTKARGEYEIFAMIGDKESRRYPFSVVLAQESPAGGAIERRNLLQQRQRNSWLSKQR